MVIVYNTYADKGRLYFDIFIPAYKSQPIQVPKEIGAEAVDYAKEFLRPIGRPLRTERRTFASAVICTKLTHMQASFGSCLARKYSFGVWKGAQEPPKILYYFYLIRTLMKTTT